MRVLLENTKFLLHIVISIAGIIRVAGIIRGRILYEEIWYLRTIQVGIKIHPVFCNMYELKAIEENLAS